MIEYLQRTSTYETSGAFVALTFGLGPDSPVAALDNPHVPSPTFFARCADLCLTRPRKGAARRDSWRRQTLGKRRAQPRYVRWQPERSDSSERARNSSAVKYGPFYNESLDGLTPG
jgi:hypothetical protein